MIALIYFMKLFDIKYFNKISQKCAGNKSVLQFLKNSSPLYIRVIVVPLVTASLCVRIASYMPHWILMGVFLIEALEFIVLFCAGTFIVNAYVDSYTYRERRE